MERYVDPNSGAAPQPGGYAGPEAAAKGFAMPVQEAGAESPLSEEPRPSEYEAPGGDGATRTVSEVAAAAEENNPPRERTEEEELLLQARANPKQVLADLDEGDSASSVDLSGASEADADADASVEHQAVDPREGAYDPSQYTVAEVNAYLDENPDQRDAVLAAERDGQARKGIVGE